MTISQYNRRNFLSSLAILSVGTAFGSKLNHFTPAIAANDLQKKWRAFWKKSGGSVFYSLADLNSLYNQKRTKGHRYKYGEIIYFAKENILAQPTWIFWSNDNKPADVVVTLFENNHSFKKIIRLNRYEMDALYRLAEGPNPEQLPVASFNNDISIENASMVIKTNPNIKKISQIQDISYYKERGLVFHKKFIYHT